MWHAAGLSLEVMTEQGSKIRGPRTRYSTASRYWSTGEQLQRSMSLFKYTRFRDATCFVQLADHAWLQPDQHGLIVGQRKDNGRTMVGQR